MRAVAVELCAAWVAIAPIAAMAAGMPPSATALRETGRWGDVRLATGELTSAAVVSPTGRLVAASKQGVLVWDLATGNEIGRTPLPASLTSAPPLLAISPDGRMVTISQSSDLAVWDLGSGQPPRHMTIGGFKFPGVAFSPSGTLAAVWEKERQGPWAVELWDTGTARVVRRMPVTEPLDSVAFLAGDARLLGISNGNQYLWDRADGRLIDRRGSYNQLAWSYAHGGYGSKPGPTETFTADGRRTVRRFVQRAADPLPTGALPKYPLADVTTLDRPGAVALVETERVRGPNGPYGNGPDEADVVLDRAGHRAVVVVKREKGKQLEVWDLDPPARRAVLGVGVGVDKVVLSDQGRFFAFVEPSGKFVEPAGRLDRAVVRSAADGKLLFTTEPFNYRTTDALVIDEAAGVMWAQIRGGDLWPARLLIWRLDSGAKVVDLAVGGDIVVQPLFAGGIVAAPVSAGGFDLRRVADGKAVLTGDRQAGAVLRLAVSDDGRWLASAARDGTLVVRDLTAAVPPRRLAAEPVSLDLAFGPGARLEIAEPERVRVWDAATGRVLEDRTRDPPYGSWTVSCEKLRPHADAGSPRWCLDYGKRGRVTLRDLRPKAAGTLPSGGWPSGLVVSPDEKQFLQFYGRGEVILRPATPGKSSTWRWSAHRDYIRAAVFLPDGRGIFTASEDQELRLWDRAKRRLVGAVSFAGDLDLPTAIAVSKDGRQVFAGTARGRVLRFDVAMP